MVYNIRYGPIKRALTEFKGEFPDRFSGIVGSLDDTTKQVFVRIFGKTPEELEQGEIQSLDPRTAFPIGVYFDLNRVEIESFGEDLAKRVAAFSGPLFSSGMIPRYSHADDFMQEGVEELFKATMVEPPQNGSIVVDVNEGYTLHLRTGYLLGANPTNNDRAGHLVFILKHAWLIPPHLKKLTGRDYQATWRIAGDCSKGEVHFRSSPSRDIS